MDMKTLLRLDKQIAIFFVSTLAIATSPEPSWAKWSIDPVDHQVDHQLVQPYQGWMEDLKLKGYEPPDNGSPDSTGDTGGR